MMDAYGRRITMTISTARITATDDSGPVQRVQAKLHQYETQDGIPVLGLYGIISHPLPGTDATFLSGFGARSQGMLVATNSQQHRMRGTMPGTVGMGHHLGARVVMDDAGTVVDGGGRLVTVKNASKVRIEGDLEVTGEVKAMCDGAYVTLSQHTQPPNSKPNPNT